MKVVKQMLSGVLAACMVVGMMPRLSVHAEAAGTQLYVSPEGNDSASGTLDAPLKTLEGARDKIRQMKERPAGGITVNLRQGDYKYLTESFVLGEQDSGTADSPVVYQAYPGEKVTISGNAEAKGAEFEKVTDEAVRNRLPEAARDKVLVFDVKTKLGIDTFSPIPKNGYGWPAQAGALNITVDGQAQTLARYPNKGFVNIDKVHDKGFVPRSHQTNPDGTCPECTKQNGGTRIPCKVGEENWIKQPGGVWTVKDLGEKYDLWSQEKDLWVSGYFCWAYADDSTAISKLEKDGGGLKMTATHPSRYGVGGGDVKKFYAFNLLCEIDEPGEWYLDRESGKLYLYPAKDLTDSTIELSMMGKPFVMAEKVQHVRFKNLNFTKGNSHGIQMKDCHNMLVAGCTFSDLGQQAVVVGQIPAFGQYEAVNTGAHGGSNNVIQSCNMVRLGQGGVYLAGGDRYTLTPGNNRVENCDFEDFSVIKRTYSPAVALVGTGNQALRNRIHNAPHMAISYDGNDHKIVGNEIFNVCYETSDVGAIYSVRTWSYRGVEISNNYIHDLVTSHGTGSAAVYLDDMTSGGIITNNLFVNIPGLTALLGGGRDNRFQNNIQLNSGNGKGVQHDSRGEGWAVNAGSVPDGNNYAEWNKLKTDPRFDSAKWEKQYPELMSMSLRTEKRTHGGKTYDACVDALKPENASIQKNIMVGVGNPFGNVNERVRSLGKVEQNEEYPADTDIGFVNAAGKNFQVKADSAIKKLMGDQHFKAEECGLYKDAYRTDLGMEVAKPQLTAPADKETEVNLAAGVKFAWEPVDGAGSYQLEIATDEAFKEIAATEAAAEPSAVCTKLKKSTQYFWRVTAYENRLGGTSATSDVFSFTTSDTEDVTLYEGFGVSNFEGWDVMFGKPTNTEQQAHTGRYSYVLDEARDGIRRSFAAPQAAEVSLWMYDTMAKDTGVVAVANAGAQSQEWIAMGVNVRQNAGKYIAREGSKWIVTDVARNEGWHELKWDFSGGSDCKMYIDGTLVHTVKDVNGISKLELGDQWGDSSLAGDVSGMMFDDVKIGQPNVKPVPKALALDKTEAVMNLGDTLQLKALLDAIPDLPMDMTWTAAEHEIARVDGNGLVTANREGETEISVTVEGHPEIKAVCKIKVENHTAVPVESVTLSQTQKTVDRYERFDLIATVLPENADNRQVTWSSSDPQVASVENGRVFGLTEGTAVITATTVDGGKTAECAVTVTDKLHNLMENPGFETGDTTGWGQYPTNNSEGIEILVTADALRSGSYGAAVTTTDTIPAYTHKGIQYRLENTEKALDDTLTYVMEAFVKVADDKTHNMGIQVALRGGEKSGAHVPEYQAVSQGDEWVKLMARITPEIMAQYPGTTMLDFIVGNENNTESAGTYYVDDAVLYAMPQEHQHKLTKVEEKPASCTQEGNREYYVCQCGKWFEDAEGNVEITDRSAVILPKLPHQFGEWVVTKEPSHTEEGEQTRTCAVCGETETQRIPMQSSPFGDVHPEDYFFEAVQWAVQNGVTAGVTPTSFGPYEDCTRGQIVTFLWSAAGKPEPESTDNPFKDVSETDYYYKAVLWAVENGVTAGISADTFGPAESCTRGQTVTFLWSAAGKPEPESTDNPFEDVTEADYYYKAVLWAAEQAITAGVRSGSFGPYDSCTRGQIVTFLYKMGL